MNKVFVDNNLSLYFIKFFVIFSGFPNSSFLTSTPQSQKFCASTPHSSKKSNKKDWLSYAVQAKRIDMKKIQSAMWEEINNQIKTNVSNYKFFYIFRSMYAFTW